MWGTEFEFPHFFALAQFGWHICWWKSGIQDVSRVVSTPFPSGSALNFNRIVVLVALSLFSTPFGTAYYEKVSRWLDVTELPCCWCSTLWISSLNSCNSPIHKVWCYLYLLLSLFNGNEARITSLVRMFVIFPNFLWKWRLRSRTAVCVNYFRSAVTLS